MKLRKFEVNVLRSRALFWAVFGLILSVFLPGFEGAHIAFMVLSGIGGLACGFAEIYCYRCFRQHERKARRSRSRR